ncbi:MAG: hypothetical protein AAF589_04605 [Planctomycetota bacterium]
MQESSHWRNLQSVVAAIVAALLGAGMLIGAGERVRGLLVASSMVVGGSLLVAMPPGVVLGFLLAKTHALGRRWAAWLLVALAFLPLYLHAAAWQAALGQLGWWTQGTAGSGPVDPLLSGVAGVAWVHGLAAAPWVALITAAALMAVDRSQEEAALLDAAPLTVLARLTLRHVTAGAGVAALWVAVTVAAEMTVTDLLRVRTFAEEIYTQAASGLFDRGSDTPSTLAPLGLASGVLLLATGAAMAIRAVGGWLVAGEGDGGQRRWRLPGSAALMTLLLWLPMVLLVAVPIANLAFQAGVTVERTDEGWLRGWSAWRLASAVTSAPWQHRRDLWLTAQLGVAVATTATIIGGAVAWRLRGARRTPWLAASLLALCLVIPGPLLGVLTIRLLNHPWDSPLAWLTWLYDHTLLAPWLVQTIRAAPIATLVLWPAWSSISPATLAAARSDGASRLNVIARVAAPLRWRSLATAWLAALAVSIAELPATLLVLPPGPSTLTVRVFSLLHYGVDGRVAGIGLCLFGFFLAVACLAACVSPRNGTRTSTSGSG